MNTFLFYRRSKRLPDKGLPTYGTRPSQACGRSQLLLARCVSTLSTNTRVDRCLLPIPLQHSYSRSNEQQVHGLPNGELTGRAQKYTHNSRRSKGLRRERGGRNLVSVDRGTRRSNFSPRRTCLCSWIWRESCIFDTYLLYRDWWAEPECGIQVGTG